jgi:undecaprenyl-phosphate 4-deoxy-4-formamido-L-arabinose transferase
LARQVSVVVPVLDEEGNLAPLVTRLRGALEKAGIEDWEAIFVLDGCGDGSLSELLVERQEDGRVKILELAAGIGQHAALAEGLRRATGEFIVTLDADLQNPPEEVPLVVHRLVGGCEAVGTIRRSRQDRLMRSLGSRFFAVTLKRLGIRHPMADPGCMLRGWHRSVVECFLTSGEPAVYLPTQINRHADRYEEFEVRHEPRRHGVSRYSPLRLARLFARTVVAEFNPRRVPIPEVCVAAEHGVDKDE